MKIPATRLSKQAKRSLGFLTMCDTFHLELVQLKVLWIGLVAVILGGPATLSDRLGFGTADSLGPFAPGPSY